MKNETENSNDGQTVADESVSEVLTEEEENRIWKREGYDDLPPCLTVPMVGKHLGVSRSAAYNLRKDGTIRALQFERSYRVPRRELFRLMYRPKTPPTTA